MTSRLALLVAVVALAGCPKGKAPPEPTDLLPIPGGSFLMGLAPGDTPICGGASSVEIEHCDGDSSQSAVEWLSAHSWAAHAQATIDDFEIEEHEVTNAQYRYCVDLGVCTPPAQTEVEGVAYYGDSAYDDSPVVWVTRDQAQTYCQHLGLSLPTEAQWERAARVARDPDGGVDVMRTYPWADDKHPGDCGGGGQYYAVYSHCVTTPQPINYSGGDMTDYKVRNMASNVAEWVADDWSDLAYVAGTPRDQQVTQGEALGARCTPATCNTGESCVPWCTDTTVACYTEGTYAVNTGGGGQVIRGGSFLRSQCQLRLYVRQQAPQPSMEDVGFRCAH